MKNWLPFEEAREVVRKDAVKYNIDSVNKWYNYCRSSKKPDGIVSCPHKFYKNKGWINWFHWLGNWCKKALETHNPYTKEFVFISKSGFNTPQLAVPDFERLKLLVRSKKFMNTPELAPK